MIKEENESLFYYLFNVLGIKKRSLRIHVLARNHDIVLQLSSQKKITTYTLFNWFWIQGRRRRYGRSGHGRTTFLAENGFGQTLFSPDYIFFYFLPGNFSADKILSNNINN